MADKISQTGTAPAASKSVSRYERIHRYTKEIADEVAVLEVTRRGDRELVLALSRTRAGRTTEISVTLNEDERRDLARLLA